MIQQLLLAYKSGTENGVNLAKTLGLNFDLGALQTWVVKLPTSLLTLPSGLITQMRVTFHAGTPEGLIITNAYIGHRAASGDAYDFLASPVQLLFSGTGSKTIAANTQETSDWCNFAYNKTSDLLIAFYMGGGTSFDKVRYQTGLTGHQAYYKTANEAAVVDKTGYTTNTANILLAVSGVESDGF